MCIENYMHIWMCICVLNHIYIQYKSPNIFLNLFMCIYLPLRLLGLHKKPS